MTKFCTQCGATLTETARYCNKCGTPLAPTQPAKEAPTMTYQPPSGYPQQPRPGPSPYQEHYPVSPQSPVAGADLKPNIAGMLCYPLSFITGLLFLVLTPYNKDRFVRFHAYQSIFFAIAMVGLNIVIGLLSIFLPNFLDALLSTGRGLLALGGTGWMMYQAYHGNMAKLPVIGDLAENQAGKP